MPKIVRSIEAGIIVQRIPPSSASKMEQNHPDLIDTDPVITTRKMKLNNTNATNVDAAAMLKEATNDILRVLDLWNP